MVLYISLGGCIHKKAAFHAYLGRMQYFKSLVILIKSTLFNWVMYFSFVNAFFASKFPQIRKQIVNLILENPMPKAIIKRKVLRKKIEYVKKRTSCVNLLCRTKKNYFENINITAITDNKQFRKTVKPLFLDNICHKKQLIQLKITQFQVMTRQLLTHSITTLTILLMYMLKHSHKKQKDSLETRALFS